jgi:hypothetical protein
VTDVRGLIPKSRGNTHKTSVEGELVVMASEQGRRFPVKVWDEAYYNTLGRTQFVLCPNGDYVWTYRFFESVLCGAIPVVEEPCAAYEGFDYVGMSVNGRRLVWSAEVVERNYHKALERLVVPAETLSAAVRSVSLYGPSTFRR